MDLLFRWAHCLPFYQTCKSITPFHTQPWSGNDSTPPLTRLSEVVLNINVKIKEPPGVTKNGYGGGDAHSTRHSITRSPLSLPGRKSALESPALLLPFCPAKSQIGSTEWTRLNDKCCFRISILNSRGRTLQFYYTHPQSHIASSEL